MRSFSLGLISLLIVGTGAAQETNFPVGPQYLIPGSTSTLFLQPIATPTLSPQNAPAPPAIAFESGTIVPASPEAAAPPAEDLLSIYYGYPSPVENVPNAAEAATANQENEIEMSSSQPRNLPESTINVGVTGIAGPQTLRESGYGLSLGEAAAFWKTHKTPAARLYTNADVARYGG
jgi:hypothetical protein